MPIVENPSDVTRENFNSMLDQFNELDAHVDTMDKELYKQYKEVQRKSQSLFKRMEMIFNMKQQKQSTMNFEMFQKDAEELQKLYQEAVVLRAGMSFGNLKKTFKMDKSADMESTLQQELETAMEPFQSEELGSVRGRLSEICTEASQSPVSLVTDGSVGYYMFDKRGQIVPDFAKLDRDIKLIDDTEHAFSTMLEPIRAKQKDLLLNFLRKLRAGLQQIRGIDPQAEQLHEWSKQFDIKHNWYPARVALALIGGFGTVLGLSMAGISGTFDPSTGFWMLLAVGAARPDLFQSGEQIALNKIEALAPEQIRYFLTQKGWRGSDGVKAFEEIQAARETHDDFDSLYNLTALTDDQINGLLGSESTAAKLLTGTKMTGKDRVEAFRLFGQKYDGGQKDVIKVALNLGEYGIAMARKKGIA